jgi:hypothetical protein
LFHALLLLQLAVTPPQAREAEKLVHASMRDYDLGYFEQALWEAEEGYRVDPLPEILFNIGQCHRMLKHWERATFFFQRYLWKLPDAANRPLAEKLLADVMQHLDAAEPKPSPSVVVVSGLPPPAQPQPVVVVSGLAPPGRPPVAQAAPPPAPVVAKAEPAPVAAVSPATAPGVAKAVAPVRSHTAAWVLGSVAVVGLVVAVVGLVEVENFQSVLGRLNNPQSYTAWQADHATAVGEAPSIPAWEWVAGGGGAVAVGTGTAAAFTW